MDDADLETRHFAPCSNQDFDFFYTGLERKMLLVQKCSECARLRNPPGPICGECGSFEWTAQPLSGRGVVYSYMVHHHPPLPTFETPHPVVLVELEEGIRFLGALRAADREALTIGATVTVDFLRRGDLAIFEFRLAGGNA